MSEYDKYLGKENNTNFIWCGVKSIGSFFKNLSLSLRKKWILIIPIFRVKLLDGSDVNTIIKNDISALHIATQQGIPNIVNF